MLHGLFVTGTDTGVGKTVSSAALLLRYRHRVPLRYWKPIETGVEEQDDTAEVERLTGPGQAAVCRTGIRLAGAVSPHLAAARADRTIELAALADMAHAHPSEERWIVEGAGGLLVPLNASDTIADLVTLLDLPVVVVARTSLGTINHTLLTLEALRTRSRRIAGVLLSGNPNPDNRSAIERYGRVRVLGEMPRLDPLDADVLGRWATTSLDPGDDLLAFLR